VEIRGENVSVKKIMVDESAEAEVLLNIPEGLSTEIEVNSVKGVSFGEVDLDEIAFSTTNTEKIEDILEALPQEVSHIHIWEIEEVVPGYNTFRCTECEVVKNPVEEMISFDIEAYCGYEEDYYPTIEYFASPTDRQPTSAKIRVDENFCILYNGSPLPGKDLAEYFGEGKLIDGDDSRYYSGKITLIDDGAGTSGYNIVCIELPIYGVVNNVTDDGLVIFKNILTEPLGKERPRIFVRGEEKNCDIIKNGEQISSDELSEWDTLLIIWNPRCEKYYVEVLTNTKETTIMAMQRNYSSYTGCSYLFACDVENFYGVAYGAYNADRLSPGTEGTFVIDNYNKIVAFYESYNGEQAYILNAAHIADDWGKENVKIQMLASDGKVYESLLADNIKIEYPETAGLKAEDLSPWNDNLEVSATYYLDDIDKSALAEAIRNQLIDYEKNSAGEIKTITFAQNDPDENSLYHDPYIHYSEAAIYDAQEASVRINHRLFKLNDNTQVFFVQNISRKNDGFLIGIGTKNDLQDGLTYSAAVYNARDDEAEVLVVYNVPTTAEDDNAGTSGCGYILNARDVSDDWGNETVKLQMLADDGKVYETVLADKIKINYAPADVTIAGAGMPNASYDLEDINATVFAVLLKNSLVTYEANSSGEIKTVTFEQTDEDVSSLYFTKGGEYAEYDLDNAAIKVGGKKYDVDEDTVVFYITNASNDVYTMTTFNGDGSVNLPGAVIGTASKDHSRVGTITSTNEKNFDYVRIYNGRNGYAEIVVVYNSLGSVVTQGVAVIDAVYPAQSGDDEVILVKYFEGGEKKVSYTSPDYYGDLYDANPGDIYKFLLLNNGTTIVGSVRYGQFDNTGCDYDAAKAPTLVNVANSGMEATYFGPVVKYVSDREAIRIAPPDFGSSYDFTDYISLKATNANVYVYDPLKTTNKISVGNPEDVLYDEALVDQANAVNMRVVSRYGETLVEAGEDALGMMDFVAAYEYDGDITDIVIYKPYDFGIYYVETDNGE